MSVAIRFVKADKSADTAVIGIFTALKLSPLAQKLDKELGGLITHHLKQAVSFKGSEGQVTAITLPKGSAQGRLIIAGLGNPDIQTGPRLETTGAMLAASLTSFGASKAVVLNADDLETDDIKTVDLIAHLAYGAMLGTYRFDKYKSQKSSEKGFQILSFASSKPQILEKRFHEDEIVAKSAMIARDLVNEPPNKLYPESFAAFIRKTLTPLGVKVTIFKEDQIKAMGMGCLTAVGQASDFPPRLVVMEWNGGRKKTGKPQKPLAFVGKGMTYDSGGLAIKPATSMTEMKGDMAGAAAVVGLMMALAMRKSPASVVGVVPLAENAISDEAYRNDDILTSYSGKTVEILNTDAEGRLILCDALAYVQKTYDPKLIVNLATLTGAIVVALGHEYAGAFVNNDKLWNGLNEAATATGEKLWRMPLDEAFRKDVESQIADLRNIGSPGQAGSCTAAAFLEHFITPGRPWAHLDIAGTGMMKKTRPTHPRLLGTGFGVRVLNHFVKETHE